MIEQTPSELPISDLSTIVMKKDPPLTDFGDSILVNADIPIKHIMGCIGTLKGLDKKKIYSKDITDVLLCNEPFYFSICSKEGKLKLRGNINPTQTIK